MSDLDEVTSVAERAPEPTRSERIFVHARRVARPSASLPVLVVWAPMVVWFLALKPGIMTNDSMDTWGQIRSGDWVDWHPPIYTALQWVSYQLVGSPALATLMQSLALAWAIARLLKIAVRLGLPAIPVWCVAAAVALTPPVGAFAMHLWKDVPYTVGFLLVVELFLRSVLTRLRLEPGPTTASWVLGGVGLVTLLLSRPNGIVVVLVTGVAIVVLATRRRVAIGVWVMALLVSMATQSFVYPALGVDSPVGASSAGLAPFSLGYLATAHPDTMDTDEVRLLERLAPLPLWQEHFSCHWTGIPAGELTPSARVAEWADQLKAEWREALVEHPLELVQGHLCAASVAWNPLPSAEERLRFESLYYGIIDNDLGLHTAPVSPRLHEVAVDVIQSTTAPASGWQPWFWRAPTWIYLCAVAVLVLSSIRRSWWPVVLLAPLVAQQLSVVAMTGPHARYMLPAGIAAVALLPSVARLAWRSWREGPAESAASEVPSQGPGAGPSTI